jgi:hypothetical protein
LRYGCQIQFDVHIKTSVWPRREKPAITRRAKRSG